MAPRSSAAISQYVLKIASRCDLKCDYCYVYEHADQSWRRQPSLMEPETVRVAARRIADHAREHRLAVVRVVLHGGEPLLAGPRRLAGTAAELRRAITPHARLDLRMQTNGVLLTQEFCDVLVAHGVRVGVSLDGGADAHDRHRRFGHGGGSHAQVRRALTLLRANPSAYAGLLCTVDLRNDPLEVYAALLAEAPPAVDFLLPHATWATPPRRPAGEPAPYAAWLGAIHRRWVADGRPVPIRLLDSLAPGAVSSTEAVGLSPADLVVIETDGSYEQVDSLKVTYPGAAATGRDVFTATVDEVAAHPQVAVRQLGLAGLSAACRACPVVRRCGGGQFPHRYRPANGFDNPSVYCADLKELIRIMDEAPGTTDQLAVAVRDDLATGAGSPAAVADLTPIHEAKVRAQLVTLSAFAGGPAWEQLVELDVEAPDAVREVITHPFVRRWATEADEQARRTGTADVAHLAGIAAAASIVAGAETELTVPARDGLVALPTLGALRVAGAAEVRLIIDGRGFRTDADAEWLATRRAGTLLLEDTDPFRDYPGLPTAGRLDDDAVDGWRRRLDDAWASLRRDAPDYLDGITATLRAVVPLRADGSGRQRAGSDRAAFGAVAATPEDGDALALLLVHEVQHLKLGAVLDVCPMFDPRDERRLTVPWRPDPRPIEGVLQGTYAFLAVADVWRRRADRAKYRLIRGWTEGALDELLAGHDGVPFLTPAGVRFAERMRATLDAW